MGEILDLVLYILSPLRSGPWHIFSMYLKVFMHLFVCLHTPHKTGSVFTPRLNISEKYFSLKVKFFQKRYV